MADCGGGDTACARQGERRIIVRLSIGGGPDDTEADYCEDPKAPVAIATEADFDAAAKSQLKNERPATPTLSYQPAAGAITQLPTYVAAADNAASLQQTFGLPEYPGLSQTVTFAPVDHVWQWGDGTSDTTTSAGGPYPTGDVTHTYSQRGTVTLTETSQYTASYVVHTPEGIDLPRRDSPGTVNGDPASVTFPVREGRTELITG